MITMEQNCNSENDLRQFTFRHTGTQANYCMPFSGTCSVRYKYMTIVYNSALATSQVGQVLTGPLCTSNLIIYIGYTLSIMNN